MMEWMMAHPWMTFFLLIAAIDAVCKIVSAVCTTIVSRRGHNGKETTDISDS